MKKRREFLSDVIKEKGYTIQKDKLNLIISPTGTGKTTYFFNVLSKQYNNKHRVVYLVDTNMLEDAMLNEYKDLMRDYNKSWFNELKFDSLDNDNKIMVMSYQKFGLLLKRNDKILNNIDLIVIDEAHNLLRYSDLDIKKLSKDFTYASEDDIKIALQYLNGCSNLAYNITRYIDNYNTDVLMMTATPQRILEHKPYKNYIYEVLQGYELQGYTDEFILTVDNIKNAYKYIEEYRKLNKGIKVLCYSQTIEGCKTIEDNLKRIGFRPIVLWSKNNTNNIMNSEQITAREYLISNKVIPSAYDALIVTGAYETGWNLDDTKVSLVVVNTSDKDTIIQVRGRVRHNIDVLIHKSNYSRTYINEVPNKFLDIPLTKEEKELIVKHFDLYNSKGRIIKWNGIKEKIIDSGKYQIKSGKRIINGKQTRYDLIEEVHI